MPFVKPSKTGDGGDCGFHAILGVWDGRRYYHAHVTQARQILYQRLVAKPLDPRLRPFLYDSIVALAMSEEAAVGPQVQSLRQRYQQFLQQSSGDIEAAKIDFLQVLQQHPDIIYLLNQTCPSDKHTQHVDAGACFTKAWNDGDPVLRQALLSKPALLVAKQTYVQAGQDAFNWHGDIDNHPELVQEYASYLAKPSQFLLLSDLGLVAVVFNKHVIYYTRGGNELDKAEHDEDKAKRGYYEALLPQPFKYSDEAPVYILFNGYNHFERVESNHIVATIDLIPAPSGASAHKPVPPKKDDTAVIMSAPTLPDGLSAVTLPSLKDIAAYLTKCSAPKGYTEAPLLATGFRGTEYQLLVLLDRMLSLKLAGFDFEAAVEADGYGNLDDIVLDVRQNKKLTRVEAYQVKYYNHDISVRSFFNETDKKKKHEVMHIGKFFTGWLAIRDENRRLNDEHRPAIIYSNASYDVELSKIISEGKLTEAFITRTMRLPLSQNKTPIKLTQEELYNQGLATKSHSKRICEMLKEYHYLNGDGSFTMQYDERLTILNACVRSRFLKSESDLIPIRQYLNNKYQLHLSNQSDFYKLLHEQAFAYIQKKDGDNRHLKKTGQEKARLFQQFLRSLVFQMNQPDIDALEEQIKQKLISLYKAHSPYVFLCLYYGIREWFRTKAKAKDNKKVKITPDMLDEFVNQARAVGEYWQFLQGYSECALQRINHEIGSKFIFNPKTKLLFDESQHSGVTFIVGSKGMGKSSFVKVMLMYHEQPNYLFLSAADIKNGVNELRVKLQHVLSKIKYISVMVIDAAEVLLDMPVDQLKAMLVFINPLVRHLILTTTPDAQAYINKCLPEKTQVSAIPIGLLSPTAITQVFPELVPYQTMAPLMQLAQQPFYLARIISLIGTNQLDFSHMISKKDVDLAYELVALVLQGQNPDARHQRMLAVKWIAQQLAISNNHNMPLVLDSLQKSPNLYRGVNTLIAENFVQQDNAGIRFSHDLFYEHAFIAWLHNEWKRYQQKDKTLEFWNKINGFLSSNEMRVMVYKWFARECNNLIEDIKINVNHLKALSHFNYFKIMPVIINNDAIFLFFIEQDILKANDYLMDINGVDQYILINLVILHHYKSGLHILIERGASIHHFCRHRQQITYNSSNQMYYALLKDSDTKTSTTSSDNSDSDSSSNSHHSEDTTDSDSEGGYDLHYRSDDSQNIDSGLDDDEIEQLADQDRKRKLQERLDELLAFLEHPQKYQLSGFHEPEYISDEEDEYGFSDKVPNPDYQEKPDNATIYLFQAVMSGSVDCLLYLLGYFDSETSNYPDEIRAVNFINNCRESLLHVGVLQGHFKAVEFLIQNGAKVNAPDLWGDTPLHNAVYQSDLGLAKFLLESGAHEDVTNEQKLTPLHIAIAKLDVDMVKLLFEYNADFTDDDIFHIHQFDIADMLRHLYDNKYFYYESERVDFQTQIVAFVKKLIELLNYGQDNEEVSKCQSAFVKRLLTVIPDSIQLASDHKGFDYYDRESEFDYALQQNDIKRIIDLAEFIHDDDSSLIKLIEAPQWQHALGDIIAAWGGLLDDFDNLIRVAYMKSRVDILQLIEPHCTDDLGEMIAVLLAQKLASDLTLGTNNTSQDASGNMGASGFTFDTSLTQFKSAQSSISSDDNEEDPVPRFS